jgi:uncharacterized protein YhfF
MQIHERKMRFGGDNDAGLGERLIQQILDGIKTATCDLKSLCTEQELADLHAQPGWFETVVDNQGNPRCNVRVTAVYETPFGNPDLSLVRGEGDGEDVQRFKSEHERWFTGVLKDQGLPPLTDDSVLLVWEFELVEQFPPVNLGYS